MNESGFFFTNGIEAKDLGGDITRKMLADSKELMVVELTFEEGSIGTVHTHPHMQATYILEGAFLFTIDGEEKLVTKGDSLLFDSNVPTPLYAPRKEDSSISSLRREKNSSTENSSIRLLL